MVCIQVTPIQLDSSGPSTIEVDPYDADKPFSYKEIHCEEATMSSIIDFGIGTQTAIHDVYTLFYIFMVFILFFVGFKIGHFIYRK